MKFNFLPVLLITCLMVVSEIKAQFPYIQSFKDNQAPNMVFGGTPKNAFLTSGTTDSLNNGYLRLTSAEGSQTGYVYNNSILPTTFGMDVEFEYFMYGGSGADGLTFFLFDAATSVFKQGQFGGSLGYAHNCNGPGLTNGYLGIGFDAFGNFSGSGECRTGVATGAGSIVVRGAGNGSATTDYPGIASVNTNALPVPFLLTQGTTRSPLPTMPGYRKAFLSIRPKGVGFNIVIKVQHGKDTSQVLTTTINTPPPANFKFGFTASTGGSTNFHEIRNLKITIPSNIVLVNAKAIKDILPEVCSNDSIIYNIAANDTSKNSGGTIIASTIDLDTLKAGVQDTLIVPSVGKFIVLKPSGDVKFIPLSTFSSTASIFYKVSDSYGKISNAATITVSGREAPILSTGLAKTIKSGQSVDLTLTTAPPVVGVIFSYPKPTATGGVTGGVARVIANNLKIADVLVSPLRAPQTVTYIVSPFGNNCNGNKTPIVITVTDGNTAPVANKDVLNIVKNNAGTINVLANDSDANGDSLKSNIISPPKNGTAVLLPNGKLDYIPNKDFIGIDTVKYAACDNAVPSLCTQAIVEIKVRTNQAPTLKADTITTTLQKAVSGNVKTNDSDADGDTFAPKVVINVATEKNGKISIDQSGKYTYTPAKDFIGTDAYTYEACDQFNACSQSTLTIIVLPNLKPIALKDSINTFTDKSVTFSPLANDTDPEKDIITIAPLTNVSTEKGGIINSTLSGTFTYTPALGFIGLDSYQYTVCDTMKNCSVATIVINVKEPINEVPIARADSAFTTKNISVVLNPTANDVDPEGTVVTANPVSNAATDKGGMVTSDNQGNFKYTPPTDFIGRDTYTYTVCDATNKCATGKITFVVGPTPNKRPIAKKDTASTLETTAIVIAPLLNDTDEDGTLVNSTLTANLPKHGTIVIDKINATIKYEPINDYVGKDTITYTICDNGTPSLCASAIIVVSINPKPTIPLFIPEGFSPNGDAVNQKFVIEGIEKLKVNLEIFNRWGDKVYEVAEYKNDWEGTSNRGVTVGQGLPDGTYFCVVTINGQEPIAPKYITISR